MVDMVMDVLRAFSKARNYVVGRKIIDVALELVTPENIHEVVVMLEKEVVKTKTGEHLKKKYRKMLVEAIHSVTQTKSLHFV
ncbi:putative coatomer beta subunit (COPB1) protein [Medicago truncatula]|uniref:Coatomer subunit beta n=1 Tax=Medicago truncatula TaxID=3880 RepID=G7JJ75_MEDTR|nr:coatomer subunit beta [Medicago truncatula]RHN64972.1 putative coatomer beta subunit (COPB1) protein [Medicago truncatula]